MKNSTVIHEWRKIWEIVGSELLANDLPASVEVIKTERDEFWEHATNLRDSNQQLIERNKELNVQLNLCIEALEELESHDTQRDPSEVRSIVRETLDQLRKLES